MSIAFWRYSNNEISSSPVPATLWLNVARQATFRGGDRLLRKVYFLQVPVLLTFTPKHSRHEAPASPASSNSRSSRQYFVNSSVCRCKTFCYRGFGVAGAVPDCLASRVRPFLSCSINTVYDRCPYNLFEQEKDSEHAPHSLRYLVE